MVWVGLAPGRSLRIDPRRLLTRKAASKDSARV
jgi:hypothetical protein